MDRLSKARKLTRSSVTKTCNRIQDELNKDVNKQILTAFPDDLFRIAETLQGQDQSILEIILEDQTEEVMMKEVDDSECYRNRISLTMVKIADILDQKMKILDPQHQVLLQFEALL